MFWNDAVPCTVISPVNNASLEIVTNAPSSVIDVSANAAPVHFVMVFEDNPADPDTSTVTFEDPSNVNVEIPVPFDADDIKTDAEMPVNPLPSPTNEPLKIEPVTG